MDDYLDHILDEINPQIHIDEEQRKVVLDESKCALVIAGAGTGKSTTIAAKVKYLVDKKNIDPAKILIMSYSRKSVEDLRGKINTELGIPADVTTFHSLGYRFLRKIHKDIKHCYVVDDYQKQTIFLNFLKNHIYTSPARFGEFYKIFHEATVESSGRSLYGNFIRANYQNYANFSEYFEAYVHHKASQAQDAKLISRLIIEERLNQDHPTTIRGEFVKSRAEARIANFLFCHGIDYEYEKIYDEVLPDNATYKPDFTLDIGGHKIYLEYFGLSGKSEKYDLERKRKERHFREQYQTFIALDPPYNDVVLKKELDKYGVVYHPQSDEEIYEQLLRHNQLAEFMGLYNEVFKKSLESIRSSKYRNEYKNVIADFLHASTLRPDERTLYSLQTKYIEAFCDFYLEQITNQDTIGFDYDDLILLPTDSLSTNPDVLDYDYIIVDEYQDISESRYDFLKSLLGATNAKFLAVGDDWQTIYSFQGSKINYIRDFQNYFGEESKTFFITNTYRNGPDLAKNAGEFIMKNPDQIKKEIHSYRQDPAWSFYVVEYDQDSSDEDEEGKTLEQYIRYIARRRPEDSILVLARKNYTIDNIIKNNRNFWNDRDTTKVRIARTPIQFDFMTMHASKGLTADWVFLVGMNSGFPASGAVDFWVVNLFRTAPDKERIISPEERRLFYVALTRTRNSAIILVNSNPKKRSPFVQELSQIALGSHSLKRAVKHKKKPHENDTNTI